MTVDGLVSTTGIAGLRVVAVSGTACGGGGGSVGVETVTAAGVVTISRGISRLIWGIQESDAGDVGGNPICWGGSQAGAGDTGSGVTATVGVAGGAGGAAGVTGAGGVRMISGKIGSGSG